eukprot:CAMPEP_0204274414 /NCGR_PEP_ID=MMETSP0468-20130131/25175_1 /ASSEMBLY_ACC=CAM_ASM_000383 /TAXON_ID=2969 /ORGANISM="Oxyrrhis marina" /LENGTH=43 /DNA_ID= /DNA_START= /DNA_END= /DNA_ORIENTATION=
MSDVRDLLEDCTNHYWTPRPNHQSTPHPATGQHPRGLMVQAPG